VELSDAKPLVSIVTPSLNQAPFLEDAMRSVLEQDYPRIEYLVVDGGSTDGSIDIIRRHAARLAWWVSEKDDGQTDAINKGFSRARGEIFGWLNSDDTYVAGAISQAVEAFAACPGCGLIYGDANYIDHAGRRIGKFPAAQTDYRRLRQGYVHIPQQASFFRADLWQAVAPLDPNLFFAMDYDLWLRIARRSQVKYLPEVWANFRLHSAAKTIADDNRCWPEMLRIHYRDGGGFLSLIVAKYYLRKLFAPILNWRRRQLLPR
jgi:glycosyltransferase involved in cell wall biosynthesis